MKTPLVLLALLIYCQAFVCPPNYCNSVKCTSIQCSSGFIRMEHGDYCGCCPACYKLLGRNERCTSPIIGSPFKALCGEGLSCIDGTCQ